MCSTQILCFVSDCETCRSTAGCQGKGEEKAQTRRRCREKNKGEGGEEERGKENKLRQKEKDLQSWCWVSFNTFFFPLSHYWEGERDGWQGLETGLESFSDLAKRVFALD